MESVVWVLIGTIIGALASIATTWLSGRSASRLQQQSSAIEREERARAFQRETLIELQDALNDAVRLLTRAYLEDSASFKQSANWGQSLLSEEVNEKMRLANRRVSILVERVADGTLRSKIKDIMRASTQVVSARSQKDAETNFQGVTSAVDDVMENLGTVLRSFY